MSHNHTNWTQAIIAGGAVLIIGAAMLTVTIAVATYMVEADRHDQDHARFVAQCEAVRASHPELFPAWQEQPDQ